MGCIILNFFSYNIQISSENDYLINRVSYIFRDFITTGSVSDISVYFTVNPRTKDIITDLVSSQEKFIIKYSFDNKNFINWEYADTFLPPLRLFPFAGEFIVLHGCAVRKNNYTFAFLAPSMSGKTTLMYKLVESGYQAISDDLLFINTKTLELFPYHKPVGIREGTLEIDEQLNIKMINFIDDSQIPCFKNQYGKKTWLMHLNDLFSRDVYYKYPSKINYFIKIDKDNVGESYKLAKFDAYDFIYKSVCNSGLSNSDVCPLIINLIAETKCIYLPTKDSILACNCINRLSGEKL